MSCGVGHSCGLDLAWLWLWHRLAATALITPLAWGSPYATGAALKGQKRPKKPKTKKKKKTCFPPCLCPFPSHFPLQALSRHFLGSVTQNLETGLSKTQTRLIERGVVNQLVVLPNHPPLPPWHVAMLRATFPSLPCSSGHGTKSWPLETKWQ